MPQYDKRFVLNVSVVYRLQIVDNDSQDLRTSSRTGQKVIIQCQIAFHSCSWSRFTRSWTVRRGPGLFNDKKKSRVRIQFGASLYVRLLRYHFATTGARNDSGDQWLTSHQGGSGVEPTPVSAGFEVDSVSMGQVYLRVLQHFPDYIILPFFTDIILPGLTQPLIEIGIRNISWG
jgi:hypothetical protein